MKVLHVFRSRPSEDVLRLAEALNEGAEEVLEFKLYEAESDEDFDELIRLLFEAERVISWW